MVINFANLEVYFYFKVSAASSLNIKYKVIFLAQNSGAPFILSEIQTYVWKKSLRFLSQEGENHTCSN